MEIILSLILFVLVYALIIYTKVNFKENKNVDHIVKFSFSKTLISSYIFFWGPYIFNDVFIYYWEEIRLFYVISILLIFIFSKKFNFLLNIPMYGIFLLVYSDWFDDIQNLFLLAFASVLSFIYGKYDKTSKKINYLMTVIFFLLFCNYVYNEKFKHYFISKNINSISNSSSLISYSKKDNNIKILGKICS